MNVYLLNFIHFTKTCHLAAYILCIFYTFSKHIWQHFTFSAYFLSQNYPTFFFRLSDSPAAVRMPELLHFPLPPAYCTSFDNLQIYAMIVLWNNMKHPEYTFFVKQYKNGGIRYGKHEGCSPESRRGSGNRVPDFKQQRLCGRRNEEKNIRKYGITEL